MRRVWSSPAWTEGKIAPVKVDATARPPEVLSISRRDRPSALVFITEDSSGKRKRRWMPSVTGTARESQSQSPGRKEECNFAASCQRGDVKPYYLGVSGQAMLWTAS